MKICPICNAWAFDDAEDCAGCKHRYADTGGGEDATRGASFLVRVVPERGDGGAVRWSCSVQPAEHR